MVAAEKYVLVQGARYSIPYFVNPKLNYVIQGPEKRFTPVTGFDLLSKTGNAYVARKNGARDNLTKYIDSCTLCQALSGGNCLECYLSRCLQQRCPSSRPLFDFQALHVLI